MFWQFSSAESIGVLPMMTAGEQLGALVGDALVLRDADVLDAWLPGRPSP
jgi:hypothetical protein